jgi:hypothetical protein
MMDGSGDNGTVAKRQLIQVILLRLHGRAHRPSDGANSVPGLDRGASEQAWL